MRNIEGVKVEMAWRLPPGLVEAMRAVDVTIIGYEGTNPLVVKHTMLNSMATWKASIVLRQTKSPPTVCNVP